jgi:hypothetical protein
MEVDGVTVLQGHGDNDTTLLGLKEALHRPTGLYRLKITYRSRAGVPARLQIGWQGPTFSREPLPAWQPRAPSLCVLTSGIGERLKMPIAPTALDCSLVSEVPCRLLIARISSACFLMPRPHGVRTIFFRDSFRPQVPNSLSHP